MKKYSRRTAIRDLCLGTSAALVAPTQVFGRQQENAVWRGMTQQELNDAYSQSTYAPNIREVIARYGTNSDLARSRLGDPLRYSYGSESIESLDVFKTNAADAPIHIFIHGGAWEQGAASGYAFLAETFVNAGVHFVAPDFSWVQDVGRSLYPIADQLQRAIAWVYENANSFGGDRDRIYVSGHSSGGHLAGVMLTTDWENVASLPRDVIKGGLCCSGIFDLEPVRLSHRGEYIDFTDNMEHDLSPIRHINHLNASLVVAYGSNETPEFIRQSKDFASAVSNAGKPVNLVVAENYNHFEIIETMANPHGIVGRAALGQLADSA